MLILPHMDTPVLSYWQQAGPVPSCQDNVKLGNF